MVRMLVVLWLFFLGGALMWAGIAWGLTLLPCCRGRVRG